MFVFFRQIKVEHDTDSDIDVDIESDTEDSPPQIITKDEKPDENLEFHVPPEATNVIKLEETVDEKPSISNVRHHEKEEIEEKTMVIDDTGNPELDRLLNSLDLPSEPMILPPNSITELEKYFHSEFFEGRPTKTPERYTKIRAFILNAWNENKPGYVSKTTARSGLKHCGDVNCISRIHSLLEQIGVINFGHAGEHFDYVRPLIKLKEYFLQPTRSKQNRKGEFGQCYGSMVLERKQRTKNPSISQSNEPTTSNKTIDANYTLSHANNVTTVVIASILPDKKERINAVRTHNAKPELELIECMRFTGDQVAPFEVTISLSTLLCLQLHSLSSACEVMGFLGGYCTKSIGRDKLIITRYKPCNTSEQSGTMCEMCPGTRITKISSIQNYSYLFFLLLLFVQSSIASGTIEQFAGRRL